MFFSQFEAHGGKRRLLRTEDTLLRESLGLFLVSFSKRMRFLHLLEETSTPS